MAFHENMITLVGNLTADPELRYTGGGVAVASGGVAVNRRTTDREGQQHEETTFVNYNVWRDMAENVAESLHKGDRVILVGRLRIREYEAKDGTRKWATEVEADEISPSLRWARAKVEKNQRGAASGKPGASADDGSPPAPVDEDVPF